ncbi:hypothetical protein EYF80_011940 [Liparis tanakae]|uniref:Uncharacterized protein n=1 Tax=Liparis tanakae TaxID=230148 RepID=A0A4Z2IL17_9TELE|nr:hypothetical protein EYF80_011940 [Liparis tanakae]
MQVHIQNDGPVTIELTSPSGPSDPRQKAFIYPSSVDSGHPVEPGQRPFALASAGFGCPPLEPLQHPRGELQTTRPRSARAAVRAPRSTSPEAAFQHDLRSAARVSSGQQTLAASRRHLIDNF